MFNIPTEMYINKIFQLGLNRAWKDSVVNYRDDTDISIPFRLITQESFSRFTGLNLATVCDSFSFLGKFRTLSKCNYKNIIRKNDNDCHANTILMESMQRRSTSILLTLNH